MFTLFDMYDFGLKTAIPLNYNEADNWTQDVVPHKKVLMIPIKDEFSNILMVPEPQIQSADLYVFEFPLTSVPYLDIYGIIV